MALKLLILSIAIAICSVNTTETPLKCWRCASDAPNASFCDDPFDPSVLNDQQKRWIYVECSYPPSPYGQERNPTIPVCKKAIQYVNGQKMVLRSCFWVDKDAPKDECLHTRTPSYIKTEFCETCTTDGCNSF
ncbi:hypothetical protein HA402_002824 [Bradysia odoriphaga]|nr:hypothetical protein HA402_002824 [Bradysia odoriphaga]